jgi:hypothetical protein
LTPRSTASKVIFGWLEYGDGGAAAGAFYVKALEVARAQQARSLELRAACDLARLWAERGDRQRAADLLGPIVECSAL